MQIFIINIKVVGIFAAISFVSSLIATPTWNLLEYKGNNALTYIVAILFSVLTLTLYFFAGRFFVNGTGVLLHDCLSFVAIIIILVGCFIFFELGKLFFICPHIFLSIVLGNNIMAQIFTMIISVVTVEIGMITKSGINSIF